MEDVQKLIRVKRMQKKILDRRNQLWPYIHADDLWVRTQKIGFTTVPRGMSLMLRIMDDLAGKGKPVAGTYLALWCHVFDECFLTITSPAQMAFEAGFSGPRRETTWGSRMKLLCDDGFIAAKEGPAGKYHYVLMFNPYRVIARHYEKGRIDEESYVALYVRAQEIGAEDLVATIPRSERIEKEVKKI